MTPEQQELAGLVQQLLLVSAGVAATLVACRDKGYWSIQVFLVAVLLLDGLRTGLAQLLLPAPPEPYKGALLLLRHVDQAAYLGLIFSVPATAAGVFQRRWLRYVVLAYVLLTAYVIDGYPELRHEKLLWLYSELELASGIASLGFFIMWLPRLAAENERRECFSPAAGSVLLIVVTSLATVLVPELLGPGTLKHWPVFVLAWCFTFGALFVLQLLVALTPEKVHGPPC